jgi:poly(A)-specific ribonuclease
LIDASNSFQRRLVHQEVKANFNGYLKTEGKSPHVRITKLTFEQRNANTDAEKIKAGLDSMVGFRKIIDFLSKSKKPIAGHNFFLDLCHSVHHFHQELPEEYQDFKVLLYYSKSSAPCC